MKKFIISLCAFVLASTVLLGVAHADGSVSFNNDSRDLPTVTVADHTTNPCSAGPADGCWKTSVTANPGDLVSVQIYFHNTGSATSTKTAVGMSPQNSGASTAHTFSGVVAGGTDTSGNVIVRGSATVYTPDNESLTFVPGSVRFYPNQSTTAHTISGESYLFSSTGINVGDITPGWSGQGVLVADFRVSGSNNNGNSCYVNSFNAGNGSSNITVNQGDSLSLSWNVSGANSINITGSNGYNYSSSYASGSINVSANTSTTYTLSANGYNCSGSRSVYVNVNQSGPVYNNQQPQAITTVATATSGYGAQLNGIAVPNTNYGTTSAWFQYGPTTALGNNTSTQAVNSYSSTPYSTFISGLVPSRTYYYRAVVQNQNGTAYGSIVSFTTPGVSNGYVPPVTVVKSTTTTHSGVVANSQPSLFKLEVDSSYDRMCIGGVIDYTVNYQNISSLALQNSILQISFPGELTYASSSQGDYDVTTRTLTIDLGTVQPGEQGHVTVHAQVNNQAVAGKISVITATIAYTNPNTHAQEDALAYSLVTISNDCPSVLGASVFGFGAFLPQTLLQWLLLILVILALIVLARSLYKKKDEPVKTA